ncbi:hypothetical protein LSH36_432g02042 [Paralvinella palmiformis]|uniref:Cation efflux protein transmembrane domain-containing protein n=1 Tax=Paralvinella palmiformis TaxID=53620 RepID=A0AAD9JB14_9ANNE|nr:hypothetical protein LSH36_432g02042 [Paralvinella palmiformis]
MLPLHAHDKGYKPGWRLKEKLAGWFRLIFSNPDSRNLFMFLLLNLMMAFVELFYGMWTNSLGLISDSFHMFFDCTALLAGLVASLISRWRANETFSYGYVRAEVLAGFVNGLFLLFIAFFIMSEAVERAFEPPEVHHDRLFVVSVAGFFVNVIGIFIFQHGGSHGHSHGGSHGHSHGLGYVEPPSQVEGTQNKILEGVFLHILADTLGSIGVIISSGLIHMYGWMIADPVCSMLISLLIGLRISNISVVHRSYEACLFSVIPLLQESISVLMQRQPPQLDNGLPSCYHKVSQLDGVYGVHEPHFWTLCSEVYVGAIKLEVAPQADVKYIQSQTHNIFTAVGVKQLYVEIDIADI